MPDVGKFLVFDDAPYYPHGEVHDNYNDALKDFEGRSIGGYSGAKNVYMATIVIHKNITVAE